MASIPTPKIFAAKLSQVPLTCPGCHTTTVVNMTPHKDTQSVIKARCKCGCVFDIHGISKEARKYYRKRTTLPGSYMRTDVDISGIVKITNVSFSGVSFKTEKAHEIEVGDRLGIKFMLDDGSR